MNTMLAIPVWNDRVSSTFDFARRVLVVEVDGKWEVSRHEIHFADLPVDRKARKLRDLGVQVVICGVVSDALADAVVQAGIRIIPYVSGEVESVLDAELRGSLAESCFLQPGCPPGARRRWRQRGGHCHGRGREPETRGIGRKVSD